MEELLDLEQELSRTFEGYVYTTFVDSNSVPRQYFLKIYEISQVDSQKQSLSFCYPFMFPLLLVGMVGKY